MDKDRWHWLAGHAEFALHYAWLGMKGVFQSAATLLALVFVVFVLQDKRVAVAFVDIGSAVAGVVGMLEFRARSLPQPWSTATLIWLASSSIYIVFCMFRKKT
jgi:hypothetical protein